MLDFYLTATIMRAALFSEVSLLNTHENDIVYLIVCHEEERFPFPCTIYLMNGLGTRLVTPLVIHPYRGPRPPVISP